MASESRSRSSSKTSMPSSGSSSSTKKKAKEAQRKASQAAEKATEAAKTASNAVGKAVNGAADGLGGWRELDKYVKDYNPTLHEFVEKSFLKKIGTASKSSKFVVLLVALAIIQSTLPLFAWPLDFVAHLLSFVFLYNMGSKELKNGFGSSESRAFKVKSILTVYLFISMLEVIPSFAFDTTHHLGALWNFTLPVMLFVVLDRKNPKDTIAVWICDSLFAQFSNVVDSVIPDGFVISFMLALGQGLISQGSDQTTTFLAAGILGLLFWTGLLGATGSHIAVYLYLFVSTVHNLGKDFILPSTSTSGFSSQMTTWHNLLAIWLWHLLISAVEGLQIPGLISIRGWILYHLPSYYLWMTGLFFLMMMTKKTASGGKASTWYANWLAGRSGSNKSGNSSSSGRESRGSSSSRSSSGNGQRSSRK